eukprot:Nk52_evm6s234 gene=Nk52_evmTU6s234
MVNVRSTNILVAIAIFSTSAFALTITGIPLAWVKEDYKIRNTSGEVYSLNTYNLDFPRNITNSDSYSHRKSYRNEKTLFEIESGTMHKLTAAKALNILAIIAIGLTTVLSIVATFIAVSKEGGRVPFPMAISIHILSCFGFLFTFICILVFIWLVKDDLETEDTSCSFGFGFFLFSVSMVFSLPGAFLTGTTFDDTKVTEQSNSLPLDSVPSFSYSVFPRVEANEEAKKTCPIGTIQLMVEQ